MKNEEQKKSKKAFKVILIFSGIIFFLMVVGIGSCIYRISESTQILETLKGARATEEEIKDYMSFLEADIAQRLKEKERYEDVIPEDIKALAFDNNAQAGDYFRGLLSSLGDTAGEQSALSAAYLAYCDYYDALSAKDQFLYIMSNPRVSKIAAKALMNANPRYAAAFNKSSPEKTEQIQRE